jgi:SNF2 family DNA or RNA helicase
MDAFLNRVDTYIGNVTYQPVTKPFSYQIDSFNYSVNHNKFLLADEQGLGKTKQALDIAISRKSHMKHCLIICGVNELKWNWFNEVKLHTTETAHILGLKENGKIGSVADRLNDLQSNLDSFFLITNIETLRDENIQKQITTMSQMGVIGMTILDECHKCKNYTSQQGKAIHCCDTYYKLALM